MLKACCDCIAAGIREEPDVYGTQLNGTSLRAPLYPDPRNMNNKIYLLPTNFKAGDQITIQGVLNSNPQRFLISLAADIKPDSANIPYNIQFNFLTTSDSDNGISLTVIENGIQIQKYETAPNLTALELFSGSGSNPIPFEITLQNEHNDVVISKGASHVGTINSSQLSGMIKYLILDGDVETVKKLEFQFA